MPSPIKAIKGGVQGVKNTNLAAKVNNTMAKKGTLSPNGVQVKKVTVGPINVIKGFVSGAKNPDKASAQGSQLKNFRAAQKKNG